ncbi:AAA domain-containing protein [Dysgonomonas capnocytophagoides]|uniref:AAA domain-containing protein n=1 Tax=Dysgonomonas capnocytophagoides TaxID=45254 RepID=UPI00292741C4|nr:AAA domain-containing protein [Dysgonomonas capnocytophagoides]
MTSEYLSQTNYKYEAVLLEITDIDISISTLREKYISLKKVLERNCKEITSSETLQFPSLFSRLVFIAQKYNLPPSLEWQLQTIRVKTSFLLKNENNLVSPQQYKNAYNTIKSFCSIIYNDEEYPAEDFDIERDFDNIEKDKNTHCLRVQITKINRVENLLTGITEDISDKIDIRYNVENVNAIFNSSIDKIWIGAQINITDYYIDKGGYYIPKFIVLEPDYLIDASAMAECFQNYSTSYLHYFRKRFEPPANSHYILMGNLANFFLDELIFAEDPENLTFDYCFLKAFKEKPFEFTSCSDIKQVGDFRTFMSKAKTQFANIKRVITQDFPVNKINPANCTLEPSFFCERYGFQGRLDLLQLSENKAQIIELKSGGVPYPKNDQTKIALNHEIQTTIYRLIIKSVFELEDRKISSSILYSAAENQGENLRMAAPYQKLEKEIINQRNLIIATEHAIYTGDSNTVDNLFRHICNLDNYGKVPDFFTQQILDFDKQLRTIPELEKAYFYRFITFIARELYIQKIGDNYFESNSSTASLWTTEYKERLDSFDLVEGLKIIDIDDSGKDMKILFQRSDNVDFINFREGEICILYPKEKEEDSALTNQILKGTIAEISNNNLLLRFRYKQKNRSYFEKHTTWVIEHDKLDHTYVNMYKSLFSFISSPIRKRQLLLGVAIPKSKDRQSVNYTLNKEDKQNFILNKAIDADDYFLIVGPPGTGKTSIYARKLLEHYYNNTKQNILVIAYTNRAVDELCESINQAFNCDDRSCDKYIRIGTELSCNDNYRHRLLQNIAAKTKSREELRNIIQKQRIFVGTLAAITGRPEIFDLKDFHLALIDEASQILEPQVIGILPKVDKFIMIGDHKQLSTITLQDENKSKVEDHILNIIKLYNCRESLFERLFRQCKSNGWEHAYDTLTYQGRMHKELAEFPNKHFYDSILLTTNDWQTENLIQREINLNSVYHKIVLNKRRHFFDCSEISNSQSDKVNYNEADIVVSLSNSILEIYKELNLEFIPDKTLGIITPYRNQIALIKHKLFQSQNTELQDIMIDTVERFQGSQRDIIILSFCINKPYQLDFFCNLNTEKTVDRKLNVALTRARQQFFAVGNSQILSINPIYKQFLASFQ